MREYQTYFGEAATFPVISVRRRNRYVDGKPTDQFDSDYTIIHNYEQIEVLVADDGKAVKQEQIKQAADAGTPIKMTFYDLEVTIRATKNPWQLRAEGRASKAIVFSSANK